MMFQLDANWNQVPVQVPIYFEQRKKGDSRPQQNQSDRDRRVIGQPTLNVQPLARGKGDAGAGDLKELPTMTDLNVTALLSKRFGFGAEPSLDNIVHAWPHGKPGPTVIIPLRDIRIVRPQPDEPYRLDVVYIVRTELPSGIT